LTKRLSVLHPTTKSGSARYTTSAHLISLLSMPKPLLPVTWIWPCFDRVFYLFYHPLFNSASERPTAEQNEARSNAFPNSPFCTNTSQTTTTLTTNNIHPRTSSSRHGASFLFHHDGRHWDELCDARSDGLRTSFGDWDMARHHRVFFFFFFCFFGQHLPYGT
jgi:hypothetical protein